METLVAQITNTVRERGHASLHDIALALPEEKRGSVKATLTKLVKQGVLRRVAKGVYEVVAPLPEEALSIYEAMERISRQMSTVELQLMQSGPGRFGLRGSVRQKVLKLNRAIQASRYAAIIYPDPRNRAHLRNAADLLESRGRELLKTIDKLEMEDPQPEPLRGGRGRPAKYQ